MQIIFRILLKDILRFGVVSLAFFLSFSGTFYFALRSEYDLPHTVTVSNDTVMSNNISNLVDAVSQKDSESLHSGSTLFETGY